MATLNSVHLLSILLVNLPNRFSLADSPGPPPPPSPPECFSPCDEQNCLVDIYCAWDPRQEPQIPTFYSLHWESANSEEGPVINGTSLSRFIRRRDFSNLGELRVWVQANNQYGSAKSQEVVFSTADIIKPPPPKVTSHYEGLEIYWNSTCDQLKFSLGLCAVRYRTEADRDWLEDEGGFYGSYTIDSPQPCTAYEFQVQCACDTGLTSDWSAIHTIQGIEATPVGELDVWRDCGISPTSFDCILIWKRLPTSQACGVILGYEVRLSYSNGNVVLVNVSTAEPRGKLVCDEMQCHLTSSLKDVSSVNVSAYNTHGATVPSHLAMPVPGKEKNELDLHLTMNEENLTVSWDQLSHNQKEYLVQYKQAGRPLGQAFDWVKVKKSQTTAIFTGEFMKYTPYQVSLFTVSHSSEVHHLSSAIGYSLQRTPSKVQSFKVLSIAATDVTLLWEPVPLSKQQGVILYYQIGVNRQNVYNVSASSKHENKTFQLLHLSPGQEYEVWIRAVTAAGPGEKTTLRVKTKHPEHFVNLSVLLVIIFTIGICVLVIISVCCIENRVCLQVPLCYCDKVPDPHNSRIFREMKHQINDQIDQMAWICIPAYEPHPKISLLEVVEIQPWASKSSHGKTSDADGLTGTVVGVGSSQMDCQDDQREDAVTEECQKTDHRYGRQAYSKMVDSDEEREREDCSSSSEDEKSMSGYEKHFMPTASEILEVS